MGYNLNVVGKRVESRVGWIFGHVWKFNETDVTVGVEMLGVRGEIFQLAGMQLMLLEIINMEDNKE
jgi:hypothetical protein